MKNKVKRYVLYTAIFVASYVVGNFIYANIATAYSTSDTPTTFNRMLSDIFSVAIASAATFEATGFGTETYNGCYEETGEDFGGKPIYTNQIQFLAPSAFDNYWRMMPEEEVVDPPTSAAYYVMNATDPTGNYTLDSLGDSPAGSVTGSDCGDVPPDPELATSTNTTIIDPNRDFFFGLVSFFVSMWFVIYLFKARR